jgi:signal transduction histidine kinase
VAVTTDGTNVVLEVRDDGRGFDPAATYAGHLGLTTMRSRADDIGAQIHIDSARGCGTVVRVQLPIAHMDAQA